MIKQCVRCQQRFVLDQMDLDFYKQMAVPPPTWCPQCRLIRRLSFYNMRSLYQDQCDLCGKSMLSMYSSDKPYTVYCNTCWWSDQWEAMTYGTDYDFSKPFFTQFKQLMQRVPLMALCSDTPTLENSDYCMNVGHLKNCYLVFHSDYVEDSYYCDNITKSKDCFDCNMVDESELCYWSSNIKKCYRTFYSIDCNDSSDIYFSRNLVGCTNCFGSANLHNQNYYWFNQPLDKDTYLAKLASVDFTSNTEIHRLKTEASNNWLQYPVKYMHGKKNDSVSGDYVDNSRHTYQAYQVSQAENCKYIMLSGLNPIRDSYDYLSWGNNVERAYECVGVGENVYNVKFSIMSWPDCRNLEYALLAINSADIFGCVGVRKKQYCILNKQYSASAYHDLVKKIKQHMIDMPYVDTKGLRYTYGEFFPLDLSMYTYNETLAQAYFPLTETKTTQCTHPFKIIAQELAFYQKMRLPQPHLCPNCRLAERFKFQNPMTLWHRQCMNKGCKNEFETTYASDRKELVYCEDCYQRIVA